MGVVTTPGVEALEQLCPMPRGGRLLLGGAATEDMCTFVKCGEQAMEGLLITAKKRFAKAMRFAQLLHGFAVLRRSFLSALT